MITNIIFLRSDSPITSDKPHYENVPFEVPSSWVWTTLGEIGNWQSGATPSRLRKDYYGGNIPWLKTGDLNDGYISDIPEYITETALKETSVKLNPKDSVLIAMYGATIGKVGILSFPATTNQACCACTDYLVKKMYLFYFLLANREKFIAMGGGGAQPNISKEKIVSTLIPLPPKQEQSRIVEGIEHWLSLVDCIEKNKDNLQRTIKEAKSKILTLAIHGKLVPQAPTDEPASEQLKRINPKAEIISDNGHYQKLPEGWCKCSFDDIFNITMGQSPNGCSINHQQGIEFHQGKILFGEKYLKRSDMFTDAPTKLATPNSLLLCVRAPVGVVNITQREICIGRGLCSLKPNAAINLDYAYHALTTYQSDFDSKSTGSTFKAISGSIIRNEVFALPPLQEQYRIVTKIEEIFAQLDAIEASL
jgi:type I restriction enzyme S subunit